MGPTEGNANMVESHRPSLADLPDRDGIIAILSAPDAPPFITLDLAESDGDMEGTMFVGLDAEGNLVELGG